MKYARFGFILLLCVLTFAGCGGTKVYTKPYSPGKILLLPVRDVVQNGLPHEKGGGSGKYFQEHFIAKMSNSPFEIVLLEDPNFNNLKIASKEKAIAEARKYNTDYCLQVVLGEFLNAAPMTFRPDYVYLDQAMMYNAKTEEVVWELAKPLYLKKSNIGNHLGLIKYHSSAIAKSIIKHMQK